MNSLTNILHFCCTLMKYNWIAKYIGGHYGLTLATYLTNMLVYMY